MKFSQILSFRSKSEILTKLKKTNPIGISVFGYENKEKHPSCEKNVVKKNIWIWKETLCSYQKL